MRDAGELTNEKRGFTLPGKLKAGGVQKTFVCDLEAARLAVQGAPSSVPKTVCWRRRQCETTGYARLAATATSVDTHIGEEPSSALEGQGFVLRPPHRHCRARRFDRTRSIRHSGLPLRNSVRNSSSRPTGRHAGAVASPPRKRASASRQDLGYMPQGHDGWIPLANSRR